MTDSPDLNPPVDPDDHYPAPTQSDETRSQYLLDGRRVVVADLIAVGLLAPGDSLRFLRARAGETHKATIREDGWLVLSDGRAFRSPSKAAAVAASAQALDGWHAWTVEATGRTLDSYRQDLLDAAANEPQASGPSLSEDIRRAQDRHNRLKDARSRAATDDPVELPVRELLDWWGANRRGSRVTQQIEADLANYGLTTSPSFLKVTPDTTIRIVSRFDEIDDDIAPHAGTGPAPADRPPTISEPPTQGQDGGAIDADEPERPSLGPTAGNLPAGMGPLVSVTPQATFEEAITQMLLNDFSQLAVLSGRHTLIGAVSWKSIAQARNANPNASLIDATFRVREVRYDDRLVDVLPALRESEFVFVRDQTNAVRGIVTTADIVEAYDELAVPFMLIGAVDQALRAVIGSKFTIAEITPLCDADGARALLSFDDLSMGDYQRVLENPELWSKLGWPLDRTAFVRRLDHIREIRNDVMHFNPDPIPADAVGMLKNVLSVLEDYGS